MPKTIHSLANKPEYYVWWNMIQRCHNATARAYKNYGAKGISVCPRWRSSVENFYHDMGPRPNGCSLDRKDNALGYSPDNCRWATEEEQRNNKSTSHYLVVDGVSLTLSQWSRRTGVDRTTMISRIKRGLDPRKVISNAVR